MRREHRARSASVPAELLVFRPPRRRAASGYSLTELLAVLGLVVTLGATTTPQVLVAREDAQAVGAVRFLAAKLQEARMEAVMRTADVGLQFAVTPTGFAYAVYVDGNGNGIRSADIDAGIDPQISALERLPDRFAGVEFGVLAGLPAVDPSGTPPGDDPIKLGVSNILTYTPLGTSSSGSLYIRGRRDLQFVLRIFGDTAKTRALRFDSKGRQWKPL